MALYHYTSEAGFSGIVLSKKMRVIQSTQSNDEKDTVHIYDLINENKEFFYKEIDEKKVIIDLLLDFFCKFKDDQTENTNVEKSYKTFVICFTEKRDNRMLWETYAGNEGYCLGFDSRKLQEFFDNASTKEQLSRKANIWYMTGTIYDKDKQLGLIKQIIMDEISKFSDFPLDKFSENIPELIMPYQLNYVDEDGKVIYESTPKAYSIRIRQKYEFLSRNIAMNLLFVAPLLKHDYWEDENEVRLILYRQSIDDDLVNLKIDDKGRNYVEIEFSESVLSEIIIAPFNDKTVDEVKYELSCNNYDINNINVINSSGTGRIRKK